MSDTWMARRSGVGALLAVLLALSMGACDMWPQEPRQPALTDVMLRTPHASDQAIRVVFSEPAGAFEPAPGFQSFREPAAARTVLVIASKPLAAGEIRIGTLEVGPTGAAEAMTAEVIEVARSDHALREQLDGYAVRLLPRAPGSMP